MKEIKEWYTCELPNGKITTYTLEECKEKAEAYLRGECDEFYCGKYIIADIVEIYKHTPEHNPKEILYCWICENEKRGKEKVAFDYGIFGFMSEWKNSY